MVKSNIGLANTIEMRKFAILILNRYGDGKRVHVHLIKFCHFLGYKANFILPGKLDKLRYLLSKIIGVVNLDFGRIWQIVPGLA